MFRAVGEYVLGPYETPQLAREALWAEMRPYEEVWWLYSEQWPEEAYRGRKRLREDEEMAERANYPPKLYPSTLDWNSKYEVTIGKRFDFDGGYYQRVILDGTEQSLLIDTEKDPALDLSGYQVGDIVTIARAKSGDNPWEWEVNGESGGAGKLPAPTSPTPSTHSKVGVGDSTLVFLEHLQGVKWALDKAGMGDISNDKIADLAMAMTAMNKTMSEYAVLPKEHGETKESEESSDDDLPF